MVYAARSYLVCIIRTNSRAYEVYFHPGNIIPANNVDSMLGHRLRRWHSIESTLGTASCWLVDTAGLSFGWDVTSQQKLNAQPILI